MSLEPPAAPRRTVRAAALQLDVGLDAELNLAAVEAALVRAASEGVELVVLPEMWATSFPPSGGVTEETLRASARAQERLAELSAVHGLCVAGSGYARTDSLPTNRLRIFDRGREVLAYDKVHLFTPTAERAAFSAGSAPPRAVETSVGRLSGVVCYDLRFPEGLRVPFRQGVDLVVIPAQWPATPAHHWRTPVPATATENQAFVVADLELDEARRYRTRVPVLKDERVDLYRGWLSAGG